MSYKQAYEYQKKKQKERADRIRVLILLLLALAIVTLVLVLKGGVANDKEPVQKGATTEQCNRSWDTGNGTGKEPGTAGTTEEPLRSCSSVVGERQTELTNLVGAYGPTKETPCILEDSDSGISDTGSNTVISLGDFRITVYCACVLCCGKEEDDPAYGITYTGTQVTEGWTIAADPDVIPLGSLVEINGHIYHVEDIGSAVKGNTVDIYMADHETATEFGVQNYEVFLVKGKTNVQTRRSNRPWYFYSTRRRNYGSNRRKPGNQCKGYCSGHYGRKFL